LNNIAQRLIIQHILESTRDGPLPISDMREKLHITNEALNRVILQLSLDGLITVREKLIEASLDQRLELAVKAVGLGGDLERVSKSLGWMEFEELVARVFRENGYNTRSRYRFKAEGRRWEIDVLATSYPYIICAECKHYTSGMSNNVARSIVETHIKKAEVMSRHFGDLSKRIGVQGWKTAIVIPITLTLSPTRLSFYRRTPCVSVFTLPSFLSEFPGYLERMINYPVEVPDPRPRPEQLRLG